MREYLLDNRIDLAKEVVQVDPLIDFPTVLPGDFTESTFSNWVDHFDFQNNDTYS
jgi:hypothetical protein